MLADVNGFLYLPALFMVLLINDLGTAPVHDMVVVP